MNHKVLVNLENLCGGNRGINLLESQGGGKEEAKVCFTGINRYDSTMKSKQNYK